MNDQRKLFSTLNKHRKKEIDLIILKSDIYKKKIEELDTALTRVAWLLDKFPHLRDCDKCLIYFYHNHVDGMDFELESDKIHNLTTEETITRVRRLIQNEYNLFLPSEETAEVRSISENAVKDWAIDSKI